MNMQSGDFTQKIEELKFRKGSIDLADLSNHENWGRTCPDFKIEWENYLNKIPLYNPMCG